MREMNKKLPPLKISNPNKTTQEKDYKIKKLQTDNWNWNDWKFHIYWNMIEWVNPRSKIVRK